MSGLGDAINNDDTGNNETTETTDTGNQGEGDQNGGLPKWMESIESGDLRSSNILKRYGSLEDFAQAHVELNKAFSSDKVAVPGKNASPEDWKKFFQKAGLPEDADKYELGLPEGHDMSEEFVSEFKQKAHELNILPSQASQLLAFMTEKEKGALEGQNQQILEEAKKERDALYKEWGIQDPENKEALMKSEEYRAAVAGYRHLVNGDEELVKRLQEKGIDSDPDFQRAMNAVGKMLAEDSPEIRAEVKSAFNANANDAATRMREIVATPDFMDPNSPNYHSLQKEYDALSMKRAQAGEGQGEIEHSISVND